MRFIITLVAALPLLAIAPALAQFGNPGGLDPGTRESAPGVPIPGQTNVPDRLFTTLAAQGGMAAQLAQLAKQAGLPFPTEPAPEQLEMNQKLSALNPAEFDPEYMRVQVTDHQKTVQLLLWVITSGQDADLQRFASHTLPDVLHHLQLAQNLVSQLTGAAASPAD